MTIELSKRTLEKVTSNSGGRASSTEAVKAYRKALDALGVVAVSTYVPAERRDEFMRYAERMRAEYYVELVETLDPSDYRRIVLSERNYSDLPGTGEIAFLEKMAEDSFDHIKKDISLLKAAIKTANSAKGALTVVQASSAVEVVKFASIAVAYSALAAAIFKQLMEEVK